MPAKKTFREVSVRAKNWAVSSLIFSISLRSSNRMTWCLISALLAFFFVLG